MGFGLWPRGPRDGAGGGESALRHFSAPPISTPNGTFLLNPRGGGGDGGVGTILVCGGGSGGFRGVGGRGPGKKTAFSGPRPRGTRGRGGCPGTPPNTPGRLTGEGGTGLDLKTPSAAVPGGAEMGGRGPKKFFFVHPVFGIPGWGLIEKYAGGQFSRPGGQLLAGENTWGAGKPL